MAPRLPVICLILAVTIGCSRKPDIPPLPGPVSGPAYFPLEHASILSFQGGTGIGQEEIDSERQKYVVAASTAPDGGAGFTIDRQGRGALNAITMSYAVRPEGVVTFSGMFGAAKTQFSPPFLELPATINPGDSWSWSGTSSGRPMRIESAVDGVETITVPSGTFDCLRISRTFSPGGGRLVQWYAEGQGVIRVDMENPGGRVHLERAE